MALFNNNSIVDSDFPFLTDSEEKKMNKEGVPEEVGILALKNTVLFPGVIIPITVGRDKSIQLVRDAYKTNDKVIGVVTQKNMSLEDPEENDLFHVGTIAQILKLIKMPDGSITIVIQGRSRFTITEFVQKEPYFKAKVQKLKELEASADEAKAMMMSLKQQAYEIIELSPNLPSEAKVALQNINSLGFLIHFIASNLSIDITQKQKILETDAQKSRAEMVLEHLGHELSVLELSEEISSKVKTDLDKQQREYFLRQQMKAIQDELGDGGGETEIEELRKRAAEKVWPEKVQEVFDKELSKLNRLNPHMPDYSVVVNYLDWMLDLPWANYSEDKFDFKNVKEVLDDDHYGLEKVKDRILEYLAVLKLKKDKKAPILCFYGPPGVGKTSLGKSIAKALNREFIRMSLGGVRDESEIRGHRRTYIGAMPGKIIQGLKKAKTGNPVFMLDEVDKVGNDFRGDPSSALLEVLDPEQNNTFQDHFLEVEYDLSRVMFIATANTLQTIHPALRDRMELIEINGYSLEEKMEIAKRHLIPDIRKEHGLSGSQLQITNTALQEVIDKYTRESGVRHLAQRVAALARAGAKKVVMEESKEFRVSKKNLKEVLGPPKFENEVYQRLTSPGIAVGLAWTPTGGDILFMETTLVRGTGKLSMTGQLGDVMKESATLAYNFIRANAWKYKINEEIFRYWDIHVHVPAGAIPKDGPSAGITILSAMASAFTQRMVRHDLAMTGEITLRGKVLPVGGIKEKVLAASRAGLKNIIMCAENEKDVEEIKPDYLEGLKFHYVDNMDQVLRLALEPKAVEGLPDLMAPVRDKENREAQMAAKGKA